MHFECRRTGHPRRAMNPCCDALGKRFAPPRPTGEGRSRPPFARSPGWLDCVDVQTPKDSHCGRRSCDLPRSSRGTLPSSPHVCWKLPGPGGLPALSSAAPLHSLRALAPHAEALTPVGTRHRIPSARRGFRPTERGPDLLASRVGIRFQVTLDVFPNQSVSIVHRRFLPTER